MNRIALLVGFLCGIFLQLKGQELDPVWKASEPSQLMYRGQLKFSDDLDSFIDNGFWYTGAGGTAADPNGTHGREWQNAVAILHWPPESAAGMLTVKRLGNLNWCVQTYRVTSYSGNGRFWYRSNWNGAWSSWHEVASTDWAGRNLIKNDTAQQQGDFNISGTGRLGGYLYFGSNTKIGAPSTSYLAILTSESKAQNLKTGGLTISDRYSDNAPANGLFVKGNSNFVGNVGIGTTNPRALLSVNGNIQGQELKVTKAAEDWPDYVFDIGYRLPTLEDIAARIKRDKHLPGMPTADEIHKNGIDVGTMLNLQQKKIEELMLYILQQNQDIQSLKTVIKALQKTNAIENKSNRH